MTFLFDFRLSVINIYARNHSGGRKDQGKISVLIVFTSIHPCIFPILVILPSLLSICSFIFHLPTYLPTHSSIHLFFNLSFLSVHLFVPSIQSSYLPNHPSIHPILSILSIHSTHSPYPSHPSYHSFSCSNFNFNFPRTRSPAVIPRCW